MPVLSLSSALPMDLLLGGERIQTTRIEGLGWQKCDAVLCMRGSRSVVRKNDVRMWALKSLCWLFAEVVFRKTTSSRHCSTNTFSAADLVVERSLGSMINGFKEPFESGHSFCMSVEVLS